LGKTKHDYTFIAPPAPNRSIARYGLSASATIECPKLEDLMSL